MRRSAEEIRQQRDAVRARDIELRQRQITNLQRTLLLVHGDDARVRIQFFIALAEQCLAERFSDADDKYDRAAV